MAITSPLLQRHRRDCFGACGRRDVARAVCRGQVSTEHRVRGSWSGASPSYRGPSSPYIEGLIDERLDSGYRRAVGEERHSSAWLVAPHVTGRASTPPHGSP